MISDLYKADMPSWSERNILGIPKASNVPPVTEIGGDIDDGTAATDVSINTTTPLSPVATKAATTSTNISKTRVTISTTSISSKV